MYEKAWNRLLEVLAGPRTGTLGLVATGVRRAPISTVRSRFRRRLQREIPGLIRTLGNHVTKLRRGS